MNYVINVCVACVKVTMNLSETCCEKPPGARRVTGNSIELSGFRARYLQCCSCVPRGHRDSTAVHPRNMSGHLGTTERLFHAGHILCCAHGCRRQ
ncbi:hypothetical protein V5799_025176 [Amblyomma americanum]|uniref:Uncharacterized protein n=1 Tax=Amblyomma americanum TaxID=6943 RepID=A0AAQ4EAH3_AMBAM